MFAAALPRSYQWRRATYLLHKRWPKRPEMSGQKRTMRRLGPERPEQPEEPEEPEEQQERLSAKPPRRLLQPRFLRREDAF